MSEPQTMREHLERIIVRGYCPTKDEDRADAVAALAILSQHEAYACTVNGELVSPADPDILGKPGHRIEPVGGEMWTEADWCDCTPLRVAVIPDPLVAGLPTSREPLGLGIGSEFDPDVQAAPDPDEPTSREPRHDPATCPTCLSGVDTAPLRMGEPRDEQHWADPYTGDPDPPAEARGGDGDAT